MVKNGTKMDEIIFCTVEHLYFVRILRKNSKKQGLKSIQRKKLKKLKMLKMLLSTIYEVPEIISAIFGTFLTIFTLFHLQFLLQGKNSP